MVTIPSAPRSGAEFIIISEDASSRVTDSTTDHPPQDVRERRSRDDSASTANTANEIVAGQSYSIDDLQEMGLSRKVATYMMQTYSTGGNPGQQSISGSKLLALEGSGTLQISKDNNNSDSLSVNITSNNGYTVLEIIETSNLTSDEATSLVSQGGNGKVIGQKVYNQSIDSKGDLTPAGKIMVGDSALGESKEGYTEEKLIQAGLGSKEAKWLISQHGAGKSISARALTPFVDIDAQGQLKLNAESQSAFVQTQKSSPDRATGNSIDVAYLLRSGLNSDESDFLLESYSTQDPAKTLTRETLDSLIEAGVIQVTDAESTPPKLKLNNETSLTPEQAKAAAATIASEGHNPATAVLNINPDGTRISYSNVIIDGTETIHVSETFPKIEHPLAPTAIEAQWLNKNYGGGDGLNQKELADALEAGVVQIINGNVMMTTKGKQQVYKSEGPSSSNSLEYQKSLVKPAMVEFVPNGSGTNRKMSLLQLQAEKNGLTIAAAEFLMKKYGSEDKTLSQEQLTKAIEAGDVMISSVPVNPNDPSKGETYKLTITAPDFKEPVVEVKEEKKEDHRTREQKFYWDNRDKFKIILDQWGTWASGSGQGVSKKDLQAVVDDQSKPAEHRAAAQFLLDPNNNWAFQQMDTAHKNNTKYNDEISARDMSNWLQKFDIFDSFEADNKKHLDALRDNWSLVVKEGKDYLKISRFKKKMDDPNIPQNAKDALQFLLDNPDYRFSIDIRINENGGADTKISRHFLDKKK